MKKKASRKVHWSLFGAIAAAIAGSLCCLLPLLLVVAGLGGAWIGNLKALEPFRPWFMLMTLVFLAVGFYKAYRKPKEEVCEEGSYCAKPHAGTLNKVALWIALLFVVGLFAYPTIAARLVCCAPVNQALGDNREVTLNVEGMTCEGCRATVVTSLKNLDGVIDAQVTREPPRATVRFDPKRIQLSDLTNATARAGYPSSKQEQE